MNRNNNKTSLEQSIRSIVRDELSRSFTIASDDQPEPEVSFSNPPTQARGRAARGVGKGRVTNPKADKRLKRNGRRRSASV